METVARGALGKGGLIAVLALAACGTPAPNASAPRAVERAASNPSVSRPAPTNTPADPCGAGALQSLVGKHKSEIPVPVDVINRRVACTTCAITEDYRPERLNIFFNARTERIEQVRCG